MSEILRNLGAKLTKTNNSIEINSESIHNVELPYQLVHSLRASFFCVGPLLTRLGEAKIPLPGGCNIGARPVDEHINGLKALGAEVEVINDVVKAKVSTKDKRLLGANITLKYPSVGATETILMASCLALGKTTISNPAREPEIQDLAKMLNSMGAKVFGAGTKRITILGVESLSGTSHCVIPDRIEAGTFLIAAAITRSPLIIGPVIPNHLSAVISKLKEGNIIIAIGIFFFNTLSLGLWYKVMKWPFVEFLVNWSLTFSLFGVIPIYLISNYLKKVDEDFTKEDRKKNILMGVFYSVLISSFYLIMR